MTISTDLITNPGVRRLVYIRIAGVATPFCVHHEYGEPEGMVNCLLTPEQAVTTLDMAELVVDIDAMSFSLIDYKDDDGEYVISKLFAPYGWIKGTHSSLEAGEDDNDYLDLDSTYITVKDASGFPESSEGVYLGPETFSYESITDNTFTGCSRGLYPAIGGRGGAKTQKKTPPGSGRYSISVSENPFSLIGREVALYVTTWDDVNESWKTEDNETLLWYGTISENVKWDKGVWTFAAKSVSSMLDKVIPVHTPKTSLKGFYLPYSESEETNTIVVTVGDTHSGTVFIGLHRSVIPAYRETFEECVKDLSDLLNDITESKISSPPGWNILDIHKRGAEVYALYETIASYGDEERRFKKLVPMEWRLSVKDDRLTIDVGWRGENNQAFVTIKFSSDLAYLFGFSSEIIQIKQEKTKTENYYNNGGREQASNVHCRSFTTFDAFYTGISEGIYLKDPSCLQDRNIHDPNDLIMGFVKIDGCKSLSGEDSGAVFFPYRAVGTDYITLHSAPKFTFEECAGESRFVGAKLDDDEDIIVEQCMVPTWWETTSEKRGPFRTLLRCLLSSGTLDKYDTKYDTAHYNFSIGIYRSLVDKTSFERADDKIMGSPFTDRSIYPIYPASFKEILKRELKLFGNALVWNRGQLRIKSMFPIETQYASVTINEDNILSEVFPVVNYSTNTVINKYRCSLINDIYKNEMKGDYIVTDIDSEQMLQTVKQADIVHPGLRPSTVTLENVENNFLSRFISYPCPTINLRVAPSLANQLAAGDVVNVNLEKIPNPLGDGTLSFNGYALVISAALQFTDWTTNVELMILADESRQAELGPSALVDQTHSTGTFSGGWDSTYNRFYLVPTYFSDFNGYDDGHRFSDGDNIVLIERAPSDPESAIRIGPLTVDGDYETYGTYILQIDADPLTDFDSDKEWIIEAAEYTYATTSQKTAYAYQADVTTELLGESGEPKKWQ